MNLGSAVPSHFFHVRQTSGRSEVSGQPSFRREHKVERGDALRDGIWSQWDWDGETLTAKSCRFGVPPLYYFQSAEEFCIADSLSTLLERGAPRDLDDCALAVFIRRLNFLGTDTPFKAIRCLPPSAQLTWNNGKLAIRQEPFRSKPLHLKRDAILEGIHELFAQSISRRLPTSDRFTVPLSGGKESRRILFELARQKHAPAFCVTAIHPPPRANEDAKVAAIIAERLGIRHRLVAPEWASWELEKHKNAMVDFLTPEHAWTIPMSRLLADAVDISYDGLNIDCNLFGETRARLFAEGRLTALAKDFLGDSEALLARILSPEACKLFSREKAVQRMTQELALHTDQACPTSSFLFWNRMCRAVAPVPYGILNAIETVHAPFLDKDYFDFVMSIPEPILVGGQVYREAISRSYPEFSDIPYADSSLSTAPNLAYNRRYLSRLLWKLATNHRSSKIINVPKVATSAAKAAVSGSQQRFSWLQPHLIVHLLQLEELVQS